MDESITMAYGSGGKQTHRLITELFYKHFDNDILRAGGDSAILSAGNGRLAFTTDSFVISPLFFNGGDIGRLAVCGTVNDLAVSGARPKYLSCSLIIEESFRLRDLEEIVKSMASAASEAGVVIATGDTKVVQKCCADKLFINTSGIGFIPENVDLSPKNIREGDAVILTGTMGDHGTAIFLEREQLKIQSAVASDCAPLDSLLGPVLEKFPDAVRVMRDPTRGGVATALNELISGCSCSVLLEARALPVMDEVRGVCELLGLDPLYMANEGKALIIADGTRADGIVELLRAHRYGRHAVVIGTITADAPGKVLLRTPAGGKRVVDMLTGDQLPRIC